MAGCVNQNEDSKTESQPGIERIFGAQFDTGDLSTLDVDLLLQQLNQAGVNTLIIRMFDYENEPLSECGVYFQTDYAPVKRDLLKEVVEKAHAQNIQVFAWMTTLDCPWVLAHHPEWGVTAYDWETHEYKTNVSWWLRVSPFDEEHWDYLEKLYTDLASYDIEGIVFQDDLYLRDNEDFSIFAREKYKKEFGKELLIGNLYSNGDLTEEGRTWVEWKCETLMDMCRRIITTVHTVNPECAFLIDMYYEGVITPETCRQYYALDAQKAVEAGFRYIFVMSYHHFIAGDNSITIEEAIDLMGDMTRMGISLVGPDRLIMKVQVYNWWTDNPVEDWEIERAYKILTEAQCRHVAYTPHHDQLPFALVRQFSPRHFLYV